MYSSSQTLSAVALQPLQQRTPAPSFVSIAHCEHFPRHLRIVLELQVRRFVLHWSGLGAAAVGLAYTVVFRPRATPATVSVHFHGDRVLGDAWECARGVPVSTFWQLFSYIPVWGRRVQGDYKQVFIIHHLQRNICCTEGSSWAVVHH